MLRLALFGVDPRCAHALWVSMFASAPYGADGTSMASPLGEQAPRWFDPSLLALLAEDAALHPEGIGALGFDPVCECQDFGRLAADVSVLEADEERARARVVVTETDAARSPEERAPREFTFSLVKGEGGWRIHDLRSPSIASLRSLLEDSHAAARSGSQPPPGP